MVAQFFFFSFFWTHNNIKVTLAMVQSTQNCPWIGLQGNTFIFSSMRTKCGKIFEFVDFLIIPPIHHLKKAKTCIYCLMEPYPFLGFSSFFFGLVN